MASVDTPPKVFERQAPPADFGGEGPTKTYRRGEELGSGGFGRVFQCWRRPAQGLAGEGQAFAVKVINLRRLKFSPTATRDLQNLEREVDILKSLPAHPNVVSLVDSVEEPHWFYLVLELVTGGDLLHNLRSSGRQCLEEVEAAFVLKQLVAALSFLHGRGVVHRDLKLENVLVSSVECRAERRLYHVKLSDFGLSKAVGEGLSECRSVVGTRRYVAPEVLQGGTYDFRVDLWSLGIVMYVLLVGRYPHDQPARAPQAALDAAVAQLHVARHVKAILSELLRLDPARRLALSELASHAWLQQMDAAITPRAGGAEELLSLRRMCSANRRAAIVPARPSAGSTGSLLGADPSVDGSAFPSADLSAFAAMPIPPGAPARSGASVASSASLLGSPHPPRIAPLSGGGISAGLLAMLDEDFGDHRHGGSEGEGSSPPKRARPLSPEHV